MRSWNLKQLREAHAQVLFERGNVPARDEAENHLQFAAVKNMARCRLQQRSTHPAPAITCHVDVAAGTVEVVETDDPHQLTIDNTPDRLKIGRPHDPNPFGQKAEQSCLRCVDEKAGHVNSSQSGSGYTREVSF